MASTGLTEALRRWLASASIAVRRPFASIGSGRECNICGWQGREFLTVGHGPGRRHALCPRCRSVERHRLAYHVLRDRVDRGARILHVAPEPSVARWLGPMAGSYLSIDMEGTRAMEAMDLTALRLPDASVDLIYCSHVLEHIPDDRAAMREMRRVLAPGGHAVVQVPIGGDLTDEDESVTDPRERARRFGQSDHVRVYGLDIAERLQDAGFSLEFLDGGNDDPSGRHGMQEAPVLWCTA